MNKPGQNTSPSEEKQKWHRRVLIATGGFILAVIVTVAGAVVFNWLPPGLRNEASPAKSPEVIATGVQNDVFHTMTDEPERVIALSTKGEFDDSGQSTDFYSTTVGSHIRNLSIEVEFFAPDNPDWAYGLLFRGAGGSGEAGAQYMSAFFFLISSDGTWAYGNMQNFTTYPELSTTNYQSGASEHISTSASSSNSVELVVIDNTAYVFINSFYVATLDLTAGLRITNLLNYPGLVMLYAMLPNRKEEDAKPTYWIKQFGTLDPRCDKTDDPVSTGFWGQCVSASSIVNQQAYGPLNPSP